MAPGPCRTWFSSLFWARLLLLSLFPSPQPRLPPVPRQAAAWRLLPLRFPFLGRLLFPCFLFVNKAFPDHPIKSSHPMPPPSLPEFPSSLPHNSYHHLTLHPHIYTHIHMHHTLVHRHTCGCYLSVIHHYLPMCLQ